jgi:hypothetical protein
MPNTKGGADPIRIVLALVPGASDPAFASAWEAFGLKGRVDPRLSEVYLLPAFASACPLPPFPRPGGPKDSSPFWAMPSASALLGDALSQKGSAKAGGEDKNYLNGNY